MWYIRDIRTGLFCVGGVWLSPPGLCETRCIALDERLELVNLSTGGFEIGDRVITNYPDDPEYHGLTGHVSYITVRRPDCPEGHLITISLDERGLRLYPDHHDGEFRAYAQDVEHR